MPRDLIIWTSGSLLLRRSRLRLFSVSPTRSATTLINALRTRDVQFGSETTSLGGGQGMAMILERLW